MQQNAHSVAEVGRLTLLYDQSGERKYLSPSERIRFYEIVSSVENLAHKSLCMTLIFCGCRLSEALNLRIANIDQSENTIAFKTLKQRKQGARIRVLHVPAELISLLSRQASSTRGTRIWSFTRFTGLRIVKKYMAVAGLDGVKAVAKGLRHAFAIHNLVQGVPLTTISKWLGHASIETTRIYLDFVGPEERALVRRAWPHLLAEISSVSMAPMSSVTEIETFDFEGLEHRQARDKMNARIKAREAEGWAVLQVEQLAGYTDYEGRRYSSTKGMMVVFVKKTQALRNW